MPRLNWTFASVGLSPAAFVTSAIAFVGLARFLVDAAQSRVDCRRSPAAARGAFWYAASAAG